jgi:tetratricopeptide (TPR) repeat protein
LPPDITVAYCNMGINLKSLSHLQPVLTSIFALPKLGMSVRLMLIALMLSSCSGQVPTQKEIDQDILESRAAQLVRVADTTRTGGDLANAMQLYRRAATMRPDWPVPLLRLGETALGAGLYEDAYNAYQSASALAPGETLALNGTGIALDLMGRHEEAQERYISGLEKAPENMVLRNNLGLSLALAGNFKEATDLLEAAATNPKAGPRTRHNLALVYGLAGDDTKARQTVANDLSQAEITNNLAFYARLRAMSPDQQSKAVFGTLR